MSPEHQSISISERCDIEETFPKVVLVPHDAKYPGTMMALSLTFMLVGEYLTMTALIVGSMCVLISDYFEMHRRSILGLYVFLVICFLGCVYFATNGLIYLWLFLIEENWVDIYAILSGVSFTISGLWGVVIWRTKKETLRQAILL